MREPGVDARHGWRGQRGWQSAAADGAIGRRMMRRRRGGRVAAIVMEGMRFERMAPALGDLLRADADRSGKGRRRADKRRRGDGQREGQNKAGYPVNQPHGESLRPRKRLFKSTMRRSFHRERVNEPSPPKVHIKTA